MFRFCQWFQRLLAIDHQKRSLADLQQVPSTLSTCQQFHYRRRINRRGIPPVSNKADRSSNPPEPRSLSTKPLTPKRSTAHYQLNDPVVHGEINDDEGLYGCDGTLVLGIDRP
jgi:hypothetical protein